MLVKNRHVMIIILLCCTWFIGCTPSSEEQDQANQQTNIVEADDENHENEGNERLKIGLSMDTLEEERWEKDRDMFVEAIEALGAKIEVKTANGNDALQISQAETLISQGIDLLVLVPHNAEAAATIVGKAQMAEIPVISYDRLVKNANIDLYISFDNEKIGILQAETMVELVPKGNYVYIGGPATDNNAHLMRNGVYSVLQPYIAQGDITVVYDQWTDGWLTVNAKNNMMAALEANHNQIDAVIAANDATAGAVHETLVKYGLSGQVPIVGQDAELLGLHRIISGDQAMTVYKSIKDLASQAADIAVRMAKGEEIETDRTINNGKKDVPTVLLTPIAVTKDNIEETVIADGFHRAEDIYQNNSSKDLE